MDHRERAGGRARARSYSFLATMQVNAYAPLPDQCASVAREIAVGSRLFQTESLNRPVVRRYSFDDDRRGNGSFTALIDSDSATLQPLSTIILVQIDSSNLQLLRLCRYRSASFKYSVKFLSYKYP